MTAANRTFSIDDLEKMGDEIAQISVAMDKASHRQLTLLRSFDEGGGWAISGSRSCAAWLSWRTGLGRGPANERMRVARALAELPLIDRAFSTGELSYSKVRALTRVADTASDAPLLEQARLMTGEQLEKLVAGLRRARIFAARGESSPVEPERFYRQRTTDEGISSTDRSGRSSTASTLLCRIAMERRPTGKHGCATTATNAMLGESY
jgi:hypothetical protein